MAPKAAKAIQRFRNRRMRVLVVDDDAPRRQALERVMRDLAIDVRSAEPFLAATDVKAFRPDATVSVFPRAKRTGQEPSREWFDQLVDNTTNVTFLPRDGMHQLVFGSAASHHGIPDAGAHKRVATLLREAAPDAPLP